MEKELIKLPVEVAKSYKPARRAVRVFVTADLGKVDLNNISVAMAAKLADRGILVKLAPGKEDKK